MQKGKKIPWELETTPLEIKTESTERSRSVNLNLLVPRSDGSYQTLNLHYSLALKVNLAGCTNWNKNSMTNVPTIAQKVWRIEKGSESITIYCNDIKVYRKKFSECYKSSGRHAWSQTITMIEFSNSDLITLAYRPYTPGINY